LPLRRFQRSRCPILQVVRREAHEGYGVTGFHNGATELTDTNGATSCQRTAAPRFARLDVNRETGCKPSDGTYRLASGLPIDVLRPATGRPQRLVSEYVSAFVDLRWLRCSVLKSGAFVGALCFVLSSTLHAQMPPFAGQGGQMPDPKQISGVPLPVPDMPVGTATARVIRGQLTNPLSDQTVELTGAGEPRTAKTDASGRATFSGLPSGSRV